MLKVNREKHFVILRTFRLHILPSNFDTLFKFFDTQSRFFHQAI